MPDSKVLPRDIVRVSTSVWFDEKGINYKKTVRVMRRFQLWGGWFLRDAKMVDAETAWASITNINEVRDGLYEVVTCNEHRDWETGTLDEWEYKLIPFTQP